MSLKLLGFALLEETEDHAGLARILHDEIKAAKDLLGMNIATLSCVRNRTDLVFLRTCIELRIPTIVLLSDGELFIDDSDSIILLENLLSVSLANYRISGAEPHLPILEWSDALICVGAKADDELVSDAIALGIPLRRVDGASTWTHLPRPDTSPKHGFTTRRELLEFLDQRLG